MRLAIQDLKDSTNLLNLVLENIDSAVFLTDCEVKLQDFNTTLEKLFSRPEQDLLYKRCGNAIGCVFAVEEDALCGEASHCPNCELRNSILRALETNEPTDRARLHRTFYVGDKPVEKYFQFSVRRLECGEEPLIMVVFEDLTEIESQRLMLMEKQRRLEEDLRAAAGIQQSLLPQGFPETRSCLFGSKFVPSAFVGGDIFNVFKLDERRIVMYMIDVSGHGVSSSLVTVSVSQMLHPANMHTETQVQREAPHQSSIFASPAELLKMLDKCYPYERFDTYFTITYLVLDTATGELRYSNAGHPSPVVVRANGNLELLEDGGCMIGLGGMVPFEEGVAKLSPEDRLVIYTDGITEYFDDRGDMFGEDRFYQYLRDLRSLRPQSMLDTLYGELMLFGNNTPPNDDISILAVDYLGAPAM
ncbi:MAG: SpoIIE family protein phosphatase [Desulfomonilaceae bacterium]